MSTWLGEREKAPALFDAAENDGVFIVESPMPPEWELQRTYRTTPLYQMLLLQRALEVAPDDAYVLKTRTDLIPDAALDFLEILEYPERSIGRDALLSKDRITVLHINNVLFFDTGDTYFFLIEPGCSVFWILVSFPMLWPINTPHISCRKPGYLDNDICDRHGICDFWLVSLTLANLWMYRFFLLTMTI